MDKIVKASSQKIFGLLLSVATISGFVEMVVTAGLLPDIISDLLYIVMVTSNIGWILLTGKSLETRKHKVLTRRTYKAFIFVGVLLIVTISIARLFSLVGEMISSATIQTVFMTYIFTSIFWIAAFTAKTLKSNETTQEIDINDYFGDMLLIVFWPIGVWTIQPRINRLFAPTDYVAR